MKSRIIFYLFIYSIVTILISSCAGLSMARDGSSYFGGYEESERVSSSGYSTYSSPTTAVRDELYEYDDNDAHYAKTEYANSPTPPSAVDNVSDPEQNIPDSEENEEPIKKLMIYTATINMEVGNLEKSVDDIIQIAKEAGGHHIKETLNHVIIKVPAEKFEDVLKLITGIGNVTWKDIIGQDITKQYFDLKIRLKNAEAYREQLQSLLEKANVKESTLIYEKLKVVTEEIEVLKGSIRFYDEAVRFSTITVNLQKRYISNYMPDSPFEWMNKLGLESIFEY